MNFIEFIKKNNFNIFIWIINIAIITVCGYALYSFFAYGIQVSNFPYDWEPTDGDHLNIVSRILNNLPIYSDWGKGNIFNIYNPVYYYFSAIISKFAGLNLCVGRWISLVSIVGIFIVTFFSILNEMKIAIKSGYIIIAITIMLTLILLKEDIFLEIMNYNASALYAFFGVLSIFVMDRYLRNSEGKYLILSSVFAFLSVFTKQQGIFALAANIIVLVFIHRKLKSVFKYLLVFGVLSSLLIVFLEIRNDFSYLNSTFFYLKKIIPNSYGLAILRLSGFLSQGGIFTVVDLLGKYFTGNQLISAVDQFVLNYYPENHVPFWYLSNHILALSAIIWNGYYLKRLSVWNVTVLVNIFLMCFMLGNGGGGPSYIFPLWISIVISSGQFILYLYNLYESKLENGLINDSFIKYILISIFTIIFISSVSIASIKVHQYQFFTNKLESVKPLMKDYYDVMGKIYRESNNKHFFGARSIGVFVLNRGISDYEFCTFATYAWPAKHSKLNKSLLLQQLRNKYFAIITTGLQSYPEDIMNEVQSNYKILSNLLINGNMGNVISISVYVPKDNLGN